MRLVATYRMVDRDVQNLEYLPLTKTVSSVLSTRHRDNGGWVGEFNLFTNGEKLALIPLVRVKPRSRKVIYQLQD